MEHLRGGHCKERGPEEALYLHRENGDWSPEGGTEEEHYFCC